MYKQFLFLCLALLVCGACAKERVEQEKGFVSIFNGKDLSGWRTSSDKPGFRVADRCIYSDGGDLLYTEGEQGNYILRFEWMLSEVGNSGVLIRSQPKNSWETGFEVQLLAPWTPYRDRSTGMWLLRIAPMKPLDGGIRWRSFVIDETLL